jgi:hydroxyethylthiazole kinase-like uncharacterized protein yjeF
MLVVVDFLRLFDATTLQATEETAQNRGLPTLLMMEAAGREVAQWVSNSYPDARQIMVLVGPGNNGGDALVAARWLHLAGLPITVCSAPSTTPNAQTMQAALAVHLPVHPLETALAATADLVVDGLFGLGLNRPLEGVYARLVERINQSGWPVVAIDLPSGLPYSPHLVARHTLALAAFKPPHLFFPDRAACGQISLHPIGLPSSLLNQPQLPQILQASHLATRLPSRPANTHKGQAGQVLVLGGSNVYRGAPALAALGALHSGAGLVTVASPAALNLPLEAIHYPLATWETSVDVKATAVAVGMGTGLEGTAAAQLAHTLNLPTVLDADALHPQSVEPFADTPTVITPHPGEAARLLGCSVAQVVAHPLHSARELAQRYRVTAVLKGGPTVIAQSDRSAINPTANPAMASPGMGDVLAGVIAAYLAAGATPWDAACLGVFLHSRAAARASGAGLLAHQLAEYLPATRQALLDGQLTDCDL